KRYCAKVRWFQIRAQFLPPTTRALQAQPDCDEKSFNTRTENRNFLHEHGLHCQSTPDIESIIQDEFDVVKRQQNQRREEKWQLFFHDLCDSKSCDAPLHVRCREKRSRGWVGAGMMSCA